MNTARLELLFKNYIDKFDYISFGEHDETYKWEIVQSFQDEFDLEAADFPEMLNSLWKKSENLIDNSRQLPFWALVEYSRHEPETVRGLFAALYEDDGGDLEIRQNKIDDFIDATEKLRAKYRPDSWRYVNDQRSVMSYLFLNDPDHNYLYKATQAKEFADCVEFYDDWGSGASFKLPIYYRMCDDLVEAMKENEGLLAVNGKRFADTGRVLYPDTSLHILCFDMIYSSQVYGLYSGIDYSHPNSAEKRVYRERLEKAMQLNEVYEAAVDEADQLEAVKAYLKAVIIPGVTVSHKTYGVGTVTASDDSYTSIDFGEKTGIKKFGTISSLVGGFILPDVPGMADYIKDNAQIMKAAPSIPTKLKRAEADLEPYRDIL